MAIARKFARQGTLLVAAIAATLLCATLSPASAADVADAKPGFASAVVYPGAGYFAFEPRVGSTSPICPGVANSAPRMSNGFLWGTAQRMEAVTPGSISPDRSYEHELNFRSQDPGRYYVTTIQNIPFYYQDTDLDDGPNQFSRAGGSYQSNSLVPGVAYAYQLELYKCDGQAPVAQQMRVRTQLAYHNGPCFPTMAYCVTGFEGFPRDLYPYSSMSLTSPTETKVYSYATNRVLNSSFDDGGMAWWNVVGVGTTGHEAHSIDSPGYEGSKYLGFSCAGSQSGCMAYTDLGPYGVSSSDIFLLSALLRCDSFSTSPCGVGMMLYDMSTGQYATRTVYVPRRGYLPSNPNVWWRFEFQALNFTTSPSSYLRFAFFNLHPSNPVHIDMTMVHWTDNQ
jgi:hypothetical protein